MTDWVAQIAERTGEFLQIVNFNLRGSQYAIAGTVRGLEVLEEEVEKRREISGGKRSFILVPGIDVPFHSEVLRVGVADFRRSLERVMPRDADPDLLIGRYVPNLVPRPFTLDRDFIQEIRDLVPAEPLDEILENYDYWRNERPFGRDSQYAPIDFVPARLKFDDLGQLLNPSVLFRRYLTSILRVCLGGSGIT